MEANVTYKKDCKGVSNWRTYTIKSLLLTPETFVEK
jgi:hypothetical protein